MTPNSDGSGSEASTPLRGLELLGVARFAGGEPLERKTAALLAYLALEGPAPRARLAGLLWPNVDDGKARRNLRQCLHRLREAYGEVLAFDDVLSLASGLPTDLDRPEGQGRGKLLETHDYDDCESFSEWLEVQRSRVENRQREAVLAEAERLEKAGEYAEAAGWAERLVALEPLSEEAHRRLMRLYYLLGDRPAAIRAFERCEEVLKRELGVRPLPETVELSRLIERGQALPQAASPKPRIPVAVLRPPVLAGREAEWQALEAAWAEGRSVAVLGQPGMGKTRLLLDFVGSKGSFALIEGRPGDEAVPYATFTRFLRRLLVSDSSLPGSIPPWQRRELSRIVPELEAEPAPPLQSDEDRQRFRSGLVGLVESLGAGALAADDLQFMDPGTLEALRHVAGQLPALRLAYAYRDGDLDAGFAEYLEQAVEAGTLLRLPLAPLEAPALRTLLESLEVEGLAEQGEWLRRHTGGNPLYVLETVKHLLETGLDPARPPEKPPAPEKISGLIRRRLGRLGPTALRLARAAAVAGADFGPDLAAKVLEVGAVELAEPWGELEAAQVLAGSHFAHDLIFEATLAGIPLPVKALLHWRTAQHLRPEQAAEHYLAALSGPPEALRGQDIGPVVETFAQAATLHFLRGSQDLGRRWFGRALDLAPDDAGRVRVLVQKARMLERHLHYEEAAQALNQAEGLLDEVSPVLKASVWNSRAALLALGFGDAQGAEAAAGEALAVLGALDSREAQIQRADAYNYLGAGAYMRRDFGHARDSNQRALEIRRSVGNPEKVADSLQNLAAVLIEALDPGAQALLEEALTIWKRLGHVSNEVRTLNNLGHLSWRLGRLVEAEGYFGRAIEASQAAGASAPVFSTYNNLGAVQFLQGRFAKARQSYQTAQHAQQAKANPRNKGMVLGNLVEADLRLGDYDGAHANIRSGLRSLADTNNPDLEADLYWYAGELEVLQGQWEKALRPYRIAVQAAQAGRYPEREAESWARIARLEAQSDLAQKAVELSDVPTTQAARLLLERQFEAALEEIRKTEDLYEEARLLMDASRLLGKPELLEQALLILGKLKNHDEDT